MASIPFPRHDAKIVRDLAKRVMALACSDVYETRRQRWRDANERRAGNRAPVWCRPAGVWREILPEDVLSCTDPTCRRVEYILRQHLYKDWIGDDHIVAPWWPVDTVYRCANPPVWGLPTHQSIGTTEDGGFRYYHPVETLDDYDKIRVPSFILDQETTARNAGQMAELLADAMPVRVVGATPLAPVLGTYFEQLRGMMPLMMDLALNPDLVHRAMAKLTEGVFAALRTAEDAGVLTANHHEPMFCSDPLNEPPESGPAHLRNLWVAANSQEFDEVSPAMHEEFLLSYQKVLFQQFGAVQYGCCENLSNKVDIVLRIPNLRIFVSSFWTDLDKVLAGCGTDYTIMWRQSSAQVTINSDLTEYRKHLEAGLKKLRGHHYQIVLRELQTLNGNAERLRDWARLSIRLAEKYA